MIYRPTVCVAIPKIQPVLSVSQPVFQRRWCDPGEMPQKSVTSSLAKFVHVDNENQRAYASVVMSDIGRLRLLVRLQARAGCRLRVLRTECRRRRHVADIDLWAALFDICLAARRAFRGDEYDHVTRDRAEWKNRSYARVGRLPPAVAIASV